VSTLPIRQYDPPLCSFDLLVLLGLKLDRSNRTPTYTPAALPFSTVMVTMPT